MCFVLSHLPAFHCIRSQASFLSYIKITSYLFLCSEKYLSVPLHHNTEKSIVSLAAIFWMSRDAPPKELLGERRVTSKKRLRGRLYFSLCCDEVVQRGISHSRERDMMSFLHDSKKTLDFLYNEMQRGD